MRSHELAFSLAVSEFESPKDLRIAARHEDGLVLMNFILFVSSSLGPSVSVPGSRHVKCPHSGGHFVASYLPQQNRDSGQSLVEYNNKLPRCR